ncbi:hypothetical protein HZB88_04585, partial [archaeon]|nr:hypothetical protein [archaeon]
IAKIEQCANTEKNALLDAEIAVSEKYSVGGSPTFAINEKVIGGNQCVTNDDCNPFENCVQVSNTRKECSVKRDPAGLLLAICSTFNNVPQECSTTLNSNSATASGGCPT